VAELLAEYVLSEGCGRSIGLIGLRIGMTIWPDLEICILGQPGCEISRVSNGSLIAESCMRRVLVAVVYPCLPGVLAPGLSMVRSIQDGMMASTLLVPEVQSRDVVFRKMQQCCVISCSSVSFLQRRRFQL